MGMNPLYNDLENVPVTNNNQVDVEKIYNKVITTGKDINLITDIPDSYSLVVMEVLADYLDKKYKADKNLISIVTFPIKQFTKKYKQVNPSVHGKRVSDVLSSLSRFFEFARNRSTLERLSGADFKGGKNE